MDSYLKVVSFDLWLQWVGNQKLVCAISQSLQVKVTHKSLLQQTVVWRVFSSISHWKVLFSILVSMPTRISVTKVGDCQNVRVVYLSPQWTASSKQRPSGREWKAGQCLHYSSSSGAPVTSHVHWASLKWQCGLHYLTITSSDLQICWWDVRRVSCSCQWGFSSLLSRCLTFESLKNTGHHAKGSFKKSLVTRLVFSTVC